MKGIVLWAYSECRSTMATYEALCKVSGVRTRMVVLHGRPGEGVAIRVRAGFRANEFADVEKTYIEDDFNKGKSVLAETHGWNHLFCDYQGSALVRRLISMAMQSGGRVGIMTEAPCNMMSGWRRIAKAVFMRTLLPWKVSSVVKGADFFVNYSGDDNGAQRFVRWPKGKIIPFGYFPPPIEGSTCVARGTPQSFHILATGILSRYRGADVLVEALRILKDRGVPYRASITQGGELLAALRLKAKRFDLPIDFLGFVDMQSLVRLYETCSVYVGSGRDEPWGMRLNDALNCGAPLVVSSGMGGRKLVDDLGCGAVFARNDPRCLADVLERMATDPSYYQSYARSAAAARQLVSPTQKAAELWAEISKRPGWGVSCE